MKMIYWALVVGLMVLGGCDGAPEPGGPVANQAASPVVTKEGAEPSETPQTSAAATEPKNVSPTPPVLPTRPVAKPADDDPWVREPEAGTTQQRAAGGVGRGSQIKGSRIITYPVATYFQARDRIAFEIQIPKAMKLYKAFNGHFPRTQPEFMEEIIKPNGIDLPELPEGHKYYYDTEKSELMVVRPQ